MSKLMASQLHNIGTIFITLTLMLYGLQTAFSAPTLMVIMDEKVMGVFGGGGFEVPSQAETTLMTELTRMGFQVVDSETVRRNTDRARAQQLLRGDEKTAAVIGLQHGAQYSLIGTAVSKPAQKEMFGSAMQSIQATLTARLIRNDDAVVLTSASAQQAKVHVDEVQGGAIAIEAGARELANTMHNKLVAIINAAASSVPNVEENSATSLTLTISGLVSWRHLDFIVSSFEQNISGLKHADVQQFNAGLAQVAIRYDGVMSTFARSIANIKFDGFRLDPINVTGNRIDLAVIRM